MFANLPHIVVSGLTMAYGDFVIQKDLSFSINREDIFIIMGGSGCGKSTLLRHLIGLKKPAQGQVYYGDINFWEVEPEERRHGDRNTRKEQQELGPKTDAGQGDFGSHHVRRSHLMALAESIM